MKPDDHKGQLSHTKADEIMEKAQYTRLASIVAIASLGLAACGGGGAEPSGKSPVIGQNGAVDVNSVSIAADQSCEISDFAAAMLAAANKARAQARSCGDKSYSAAPPLGWNSLLTLAALEHATDMASTGRLSESSSTGESLIDRVTTTGYEYVAVGENVAKGITSIPSLMDSLLASSEHCQKIMSPAVTEMGAACVKAASGTNYWAQTLGAHKSFN